MTIHKNTLGARLIAVAAVMLCILMLGGCAGQNSTITSPDDLNSNQYTISVDAGSAAAITAEERFEEADIVYATSVSDAYMSVSQGKTDAFVYGRLFMQYALSSGSINNLYIMDEALDTADIAVGISKEREDLLPRINAFIAECQESGLLDDMYDRWVLNAEKEMPEIEQPEDPEMTIRIGTSGLVEPITYYDEAGELAGYDVELIYRLAAYLNARVEIEAMGYDALIASLESGRLDAVIADLNVTEERKEVILMSDPYRVSETAVVVREDMVDESVRNRITSLEDLAGKTVGVPSGSVFSQVLAEKFPETTVASYASYSDILAALQRGMIDAYVTDLSTVGEQMDADESLYYLDEALCEEDCGFIMRQDNTALAAEVNEALGELREEGVLDALEEKWFERDGETVTIEHDPDADTSKGTLQVVTSADLQPIAFIQDGEIVGYDIELITRVAEKLGYAVEFTNVAFTGVLTSVVTGKYDIGVGGITVTEERAESVLFSDPVYTTNAVVVSREAATEQTSTLSSLKDSFQRTFITENRWKLIVNGLKVTVEIAVAAMIIGSVLGFFFSIVLRSKRPVLRKLGRGFSTLLGGMPIVIILMIFYYLIFSKSSLSAVVIGIFAFSMDFGNAVAGLLNTGIAAVDPGQLEAAEAMGYNKWQIFYKITFPQAAKQMAGQFNGAVISLVKGTSVVGYITVQDLTKAGDIIRSRTYEAFFPLIAVAVIYFLIAHLIVMIVKRFEVRLDPKRRPRRVRGVTIHD